MTRRTVDPLQESLYRGPITGHPVQGTPYMVPLNVTPYTVRPTGTNCRGPARGALKMGSSFTRPFSGDLLQEIRTRDPVQAQGRPIWDPPTKEPHGEPLKWNPSRGPPHGDPLKCTTS